MAEHSGAQMNVDWFGLQTDVVKLSDWTDGFGSNCFKFSYDSSSLRKRSNIIHAIIHNRRVNHLAMVVESGWDVNEILNIPDHKTDTQGTVLVPIWVHRTALAEAAKREWIEGVKILLDAGAKCKTSGEVENPLVLALKNQDCSSDLICLLLKHGADPNDHSPECIPLLQAIDMCNARGNEECTNIVQLLLENGADPNVTSNRRVSYLGAKKCPLSAVWDEMTSSGSIDTSAERLKEHSKINSLLFKILLIFGADINYKVDDNRPIPLLHRMAGDERRWSYYTINPRMFFQEYLDLFFLHGGNIYTEYGNHGMALEYVITKYGHSNCVRWLIRHGADTSPLNVTLLKNHFIPQYPYYLYLYIGTPLIMMQAGVRVAPGTQKQLIDMEIAVSTWLQGDNLDHFAICDKLKAMWADKAERFPRTKCMFPEYLNQQMVDLQEFSDESLNFYPENTLLIGDNRRQWIHTLDRIHSMLEFLGQPHSLQWHCRRCVRENLVSLQPSVVKTLPVPARLKRYILCHEI